MLSHKALLAFDAQHNFLQHIIFAYKAAGIDDIVVVKNHAIEIDEKIRDYGRVKFVENPRPELGRLFSLKLGIAALKDKFHCFIQNIDNPFVSSDLIRSLIGVKYHGDYIVPCYRQKGGHPILVSETILHTLLSATTYEQTLRDLLLPFIRQNLDVNDERCLWNINTPEDYEKYVVSNNK